MDTEIRSGIVSDVITRLEPRGRAGVLSVACFVIDGLPARLVLAPWGGALNKTLPLPFAVGDRVFVIGKMDAATGRFEAAFARVPRQGRNTGDDGGVLMVPMGLALLWIVVAPLRMFLGRVGLTALGLEGLGLAAVLIALPILMLWTGIGRLWQQRLLKEAASAPA